jgi:hypothetical protein
MKKESDAMSKLAVATQNMGGCFNEAALLDEWKTLRALGHTVPDASSQSEFFNREVLGVTFFDWDQEIPESAWEYPGSWPPPRIGLAF